MTRIIAVDLASGVQFDTREAQTKTPETTADGLVVEVVTKKLRVLVLVCAIQSSCFHMAGQLAIASLPSDVRYFQ